MTPALQKISGVKNRPKISEECDLRRRQFQELYCTHGFFLLGKRHRNMMNFKNFNDMHTHITKTYQLTAVRMAIRKNAAKNKW